MKDNITKIWGEFLLIDQIGLFKKLYYAEKDFIVYCTCQNPEKNCGIAFSLNKNIKIDLSYFNNLKDIKLECIIDSSFIDNNMLIIKLINNNYLDVFSVLCNNLFQIIKGITDTKKVVATIINQLKKWEFLFDKINGKGLSPIEQQGLFGELFFLRKILNLTLKYDKIVSSWVGCDNAPQDFLIDDNAIEVKTSIGNGKKISISNESQLDETSLNNLFLSHLSLGISEDKGETLNNLIQSIKDKISLDIVSLNLFDTKLLHVGYFNNHKFQYDNKYYIMKNEKNYQIKGDYPRIKKSKLLKGVENVKYSIDIELCQDYLINQKFLNNIIIKSNR
ncbi:MAG: PD-(D/E)XK motif protein [Bacteroidales bacterium]